jgi:peptidyl-tRNA hydrolase
MFTHRIVENSSTGKKTFEFATSFDNAILRTSALNACAKDDHFYRAEQLLVETPVKIVSEDEPYCYVCVRNDSEHLTRNPGKIAAQVGHAATKLIMDGLAPKELLDAWSDGRGFGVKIVLSVSLAEMYQTVELAKEIPGVVAGIVHDPSFPVHDGSVLHLIPFDTCCYVFGMKSNANKLVGGFPLMKQPK